MFGSFTILSRFEIAIAARTSICFFSSSRKSLDSLAMRRMFRGIEVSLLSSSSWKQICLMRLSSSASKRFGPHVQGAGIRMGLFKPQRGPAPLERGFPGGLSGHAEAGRTPSSLRIPLMRLSVSIVRRVDSRSWRIGGETPWSQRSSSMSLRMRVATLAARLRRALDSSGVSAVPPCPKTSAMRRENSMASGGRVFRRALRRFSPGVFRSRIGWRTPGARRPRISGSWRVPRRREGPRSVLGGFVAGGGVEVAFDDLEQLPGALGLCADIDGPLAELLEPPGKLLALRDRDVLV